MTTSSTPEQWLQERTFRPAPHEARDLGRLLESAGLVADVLLLGRDCATTLGRHLLTLRHGWPGGGTPFGQILFSDLGSKDGTVEIARADGIEVLSPLSPRAASLAPAATGDGLHRALGATGADLLLVVPAHLVRIDLDAVAALLASFCRHPAVQLASGFEGARGGALSRLLVRPVLSALHPELSVVADPACPLLALRPGTFRGLPIARCAGYEPALTVEAWRHGGLDALCQVRLGPLEWGESGAEIAPGTEATCALALLESLRRADRIRSTQEYGHLSSTLVDAPDGGLRAQTRLEIFPWTTPSP